MLGIYTPLSLGNMTNTTRTGPVSALAGMSALTAAAVAAVALIIAALAHLGGPTDTTITDTRVAEAAPAAHVDDAAPSAPPAGVSVPALGCWTEHGGPDGPERICGDLRLAPTGSDTFGPYPTASQPMTTPTPDPAPQTAGVSEDSPGWRCAVQGNRTCGPGNPEGATPGCYVDGRLAAPWTADMYGRWHNCGPVTVGDRAAMTALGQN